jgi:5-oxoprolinase (ATP-hydrolysing) subunit A
LHRNLLEGRTSVQVRSCVGAPPRRQIQIMNRIDLNCDLGEGGGLDAELMPLITSANIACGAHAGNLESMIETVECAVAHHVMVGAHPGFLDLQNFGRTERGITAAEASRLVLMQIEQLYEVAGVKLRHVKLHGALYNQVARDPHLADTVSSDLGRLWPNLIVYALAGSHFAQAVRSRGLPVAEEVFADRTYQRDGSLTPRTRSDALIQDADAAVAQVLQVVRHGTVRATDGTIVPLKADTVCVHGDSVNALSFAKRLRRELANAGVTVQAFGT